jgi:excisionase family DNA binding protein
VSRSAALVEDRKLACDIVGPDNVSDLEEAGFVLRRRPDRLVSTGTAGRLLGVEQRTIRRLVDSGRLPAELSPRGCRRVPIEAVLALAAQPGAIDAWRRERCGWKT